MEECSCVNCNHSLCAKKVPIFSFLSDDELIKIRWRIMLESQEKP